MNCGLSIVDCGLWIVECGLWIVAYGLWIRNTPMFLVRKLNLTEDISIVILQNRYPIRMATSVVLNKIMLDYYIFSWARASDQ